jgi:hypothetical protein
MSDNKLTLAAIDPGKSGGVAVYTDGKIELHNLPEDLAELRTILPFGCAVIIEKVPPFVGRLIPSSASFKLGKSCGLIEGFCFGRQHPVLLVSPQTWQAGLGVSKLGNWKGNLKTEASRRYPSVDRITLKTADALLLLDYALRNNLVSHNPD